MLKILFLITIVILFAINSFAQKNMIRDSIELHKSIGLNYGSSLVFYPNLINKFIGVNYSQSFIGNNRNQIGIKTQVSTINLENVETKLLFSNSLQYNYFSKKRFVGSVCLGLNYQLRKLDYEKYRITKNGLEKSSKYLHQFGPIWGTNFSYKIIRRKAYSLGVFLDYSRVKLNKSYSPNLFDGYKSLISIGAIVLK